jgi:hypothetical protein
VAPAVALLVGAPFPRHMRAGDSDDLDTALSIVATTGGNAAYVADRRQAIERFRARDQAAIGGSWEDLYARGRARQRWSGLAVGAALALLLAISSRRALVITALAGMIIGTIADRGSFDLSAVNDKPMFVAHVATLSFLVGLAVAFIAARHRGEPSDALRLQTPIALLLLGATVGHLVVYRFHVGFPLPPPSLLFLPLFSTIALGATAVLGLVLCAVLSYRAPT